MQIPFLDLKAQYQKIKTSFHEELEYLLERTAFILSSHVQRFEREFADFCETKYCVGVNSGTDALIIILKALNISHGDEVILPVNTFIATAESVCHAGAIPVFVDILDSSKSIDPQKIEHAISPKTKAIIPVHLYGNPAPMDMICKIAEKYDLFILEDACQAHGAEYRGKKAGSLGKAAAFSFYPGKNLGAFGDAGALVTDDEEIFSKAMMFRDHGSPKKYFHKYVGYNSRMDSIQALVLSLKLHYLAGWNEKRRRNAALYNDLLKNVTWLKVPEITPNAISSYHLYTVEITEPDVNRDDLLTHLQNHDVGCGIHYPVPLHLTEAFSFLGYQKGEFPVAETTMTNHLSLPMYAELTEEMIKQVIKTISSFR